MLSILSARQILLVSISACVRPPLVPGTSWLLVLPPQMFLSGCASTYCSVLKSKLSLTDNLSWALPASCLPPAHVMPANYQRPETRDPMRHVISVQNLPSSRRSTADFGKWLWWALPLLVCLNMPLNSSVWCGLLC